MGELIGTCQHKLTNEEFTNFTYSINNISVKEYDKEGRRVVCYMVVCDKCLEWWKKKKLILHNENEQREWLDGQG